MKIGFFTDCYFPGIDGVTYTIKAWRERLEERGHEVYVIYPANPDYEPDENEIPVKSIPNIFYRPYRLAVYRRLSKLPELDVVHCHGPGGIGIMSRIYARKKDVPAIYTHHTPVEDYLIRGLKSETLADLAGKLWVGYENRLLDGFDHVTASTSRIKREVQPKKLPVGIEMEFFSPQEEDLFEDEDRPVIGYSGRMSKKKNIGEILKLAEEMPDARFVLVGEGPERCNWEKEAPENVEFRDFLEREELPVFYSSIDVFVSPSTCDTLGLSTLEANSCGTPVAAVDRPPFDRTIQEENGERFKYQDIEDMKRAVKDCLKKERDTRSAVEKYAIEHTIDQLEELYGVN